MEVLHKADSYFPHVLSYKTNHLKSKSQTNSNMMTTQTDKFSKFLEIWMKRNNFANRSSIKIMWRIFQFEKACKSSRSLTAWTLQMI